MSDVMNLTLGLRFSPKDRQTLDAFRRQQENPPTRSEAIRMLLRQALRAYSDKARAAE